MIEDLLQFEEPHGHQMDVLQHDPVALLVSFLDLLLGNLVLAFSKSHEEELLVREDSSLLSAFLHFLHGVGSWRQDEEDGGLGFGVYDTLFQDIIEIDQLVHFDEIDSIRKDSFNELAEGDGHSVGSEAS